MAASGFGCILAFKPGGSAYAAGQEDWTYAGFGNNWLGMWHILEKKFAPGSDLVFWRINQNVRMKTASKPHVASRDDKRSKTPDEFIALSMQTTSGEGTRHA